MRRRVVAVFDFDGTLTFVDTVKLLAVALLITAPWRLGAVLRVACQWMSAEKPASEVKNRLLGCLVRDRGLRSVTPSLELFRLGSAVFYRRDVWGLLRAHVASGDVVLVATASPAFAVEHLLGRLGVPVVGTEFAVRGGAYTGELASAECRGEEKLRRVTAYLKALGVDQIDVAYSDDRSDEPLMRHAARSVWV